MMKIKILLHSIIFIVKGHGIDIDIFQNGTTIATIDGQQYVNLNGTFTLKKPQFKGNSTVHLGEDYYIDGQNARPFF